MASRKGADAAHAAPQFQLIRPSQVVRLSRALQVVASDLASVRFFAASATVFSPHAILVLAAIRPLVVRPLHRVKEGTPPQFDLLAGLRTLRSLEVMNIDQEVPALIVARAGPKTEAEFAVIDAFGCTILDMPRRRVLRPLARLLDSARKDSSLADALRSAIPGVTNAADLANLLDVSPADLAKLKEPAPSHGTDNLENLLPSSTEEASPDQAGEGKPTDGDSTQERQ
jgi:hypothetical protein